MAEGLLPDVPYTLLEKVCICLIYATSGPSISLRMANWADKKETDSRHANTVLRRNLGMFPDLAISSKVIYCDH